VVTGASSGLGRALALACARAAMHVVLADIDADGLRETEALVRAVGVRSLVVATDVADPGAVDRLADAAFFTFGEIGLLLNNAGVMVAGAAWDTSLADWDWVLRINLMGVVHGIRSFVPRMLAGQLEGHVVNTASLAGMVSGPGMAGYCASKHAVVGVTECLAHDLRLARSRIGASVLCPGFVPTRLTDVGRYGRTETPPADPAKSRRIERQLAAATVMADDVAAAVIDAVRSRRFYVLTHDGSNAAVEQRMQAIVGGGYPPIARI